MNHKLHHINTALVELGEVQDTQAARESGPKEWVCFPDAEGLHITRARSLTDIPARGLNIRQATAYWDVSPGTFKTLVGLGIVPPPLKLPGLDRSVYDRVELDLAMDAAHQTQAA